jgi:hypothetical protein
MPIEKFKTFQEAEEALWCSNPDEKYYKKIEKFLEFVHSINKPSCPPGIYKFKTIEEANRHREEYELRNALERFNNLKIKKLNK